MERSGNGSIKKPEPILPWLNTEIRPRLAIDMDDITPETSDLAIRIRIPKCAVAVVSLGSEDKTNVVIALRKSWRGQFRGIMEYVKASLTKVGIVRGMVDRMIMIPAVTQSGQRRSTFASTLRTTYSVRAFWPLG